MIHNELEELLNIQINKELFASHQYLAISNYLNQSNVNLYNLSKYFVNESLNEKKHAQQLIDYLLSRGGKVQLTLIDKPLNEYSKENLIHDVLFIFETSLELENNVHNHLKIIANKSGELDDHHLNDFITSNFLEEQIKAECELTQYISHIRMIISDSSPALGLLWFNSTFVENGTSSAS